MPYPTRRLAPLALLFLLLAPLPHAQTGSGTSTGVDGQFDRELFAPPPPTVDDDELATSAPTITIQGRVAASADEIEVAGPSGTFRVPASGPFSVEVPLSPDRLNRVFLSAASLGSAKSAPTLVEVTQDTEAPELFIDLPTDGAQVITGSVDVAGRIGDRLSGFQGLTVTVNGVAATVDVGIGSNGTFLAPGVPLVTLPVGTATVLDVVASDALGNQTTQQITVTHVDPPPGSARIDMVSGNGQSTEVSTLLGAPLAVRVMKADGSPFENKIVTFRVVRGDGTLEATPGGTASRMIQVLTDANGDADVFWTLGRTAGSGNQRVEAASTDAAGLPVFCASATAAAPDRILIGSGDVQVGEANAPAFELLRAWVSDGTNAIAGEPVTFKVTQGDGLIDGQTEVTIPSDLSGHASAAWTLGRAGRNEVEATFALGPGLPATFIATALERTETSTTFQGIVLDNAGRELGGATCSLEVGGTTLGPVSSGADGRFLILATSLGGPAHLSVDGSTVATADGIALPAGSFPALAYEALVVPRAKNTIGRPVLLPALDAQNDVVFDNTTDVTLTIDSLPGVEFFVAAGSVSRADGTTPDAGDPVTLSLNVVHFDEVPMPVPDGAAPPVAWTLQPAGTHFDPPVQVTLPNMSGLAPGTIAWIFSFDHDTNRFGVVASGSVSENGSEITTDPGSGIREAGWGGICPPYPNSGDVIVDNMNDAKAVLTADYTDKIGTGAEALAFQVLCITRAACGFDPLSPLGGDPPGPVPDWAGDFVKSVLFDVATNIRNREFIEPNLISPLGAKLCDDIPSWVGIDGLISSREVCAVLGGFGHHFPYDLVPSFVKHIPRYGWDVVEPQHEGFFQGAVIPCFLQQDNEDLLEPWAVDAATFWVPKGAAGLRGTVCAVDEAIEYLTGDSPSPEVGPSFPILPPPPTEQDLFNPHLAAITTLDVSAGGAFFLPVGTVIQLSVLDGVSNDLTASATGTMYFPIAPPEAATITADGELTILSTPAVTPNMPALLPILVQNGNELGIGQFAITDVDTDGDLIVDSMEIRQGLNPLVPNALDSDPDGDRLSDFFECLIQTQALVADTDGDGVDDGTEVIQNSHPLDPTGFTPMMNETFRITLRGQAVQADGIGSFRFRNIPSGSDLVRARAVGLVDGVDQYAISEWFEIVDQATYNPTAVALATTEVPFTAGVEASLVDSVFTQPGQSRSVSVTGRLSDDSLVDLTARAVGTTYTTSNPDVCTVDQEGLVSATGEGIAFVTAMNEGASSTLPIFVSLGDLLTTVEGFVALADDTAVAGATVTVFPGNASAVTGADGHFSIPNVPTELGDLRVYADAFVGLDAFTTTVDQIVPIEGGLTDAGVLRLNEAVFWAVDASGSWFEPTNWSTGAVPGAGDEVVVDRSLGLYTITLDGGRASVGSLRCAESLTVDSSSSLSIAGRLQVDGTFLLDGGTLANSTVLPGLGGVGISSDDGTLDGVTLEAPLTVVNGGDVTIENGLVLNAVATINSTGQTTRMRFEGATQVLDGTGEVVLSGNFPRFDPISGSLRVESGITVRGRGFMGLNGSDFDVRGRFVADVSGASLRVFSGATLTNRGTLRAEGGATLEVECGSWVNEAAIESVESSRMVLEGSWSSTGSIAVNDAILDLDGTFTLVGLGLGNVTRIGGTVNLLGDLDLRGGTLLLDASTGSWNLEGGEMTGGTLATADGAGLDVSNNIQNALDGMTLAGDLTLTNPAQLRVRGGLTFAGGDLALSTTSGATTLTLEGPESISGTGSLTLAGHSVSSAFVQPTGGTVTFGPGVMIHGQGTLGIASSPGFVIQGTAAADQAGGQLKLNGTGWANEGVLSATGGSTLALNGSWSNTGTVDMSASTVNLDGSFTLAGLGTFTRSGGTVNLIGILDNTGGTLAFDASTGSWNFGNNGEIIGGTVTTADGASLVPVSTTGSRLDGVILAGEIVFPATGKVLVENGLTMASGKFTLASSSSSAVLEFTGKQTLSGTGEIDMDGGPFRAFVWPATGGSLTIASGIDVHGHGTLGRGGTALVLEGPVTADDLGEILRIEGDAVTLMAATTVESGGELQLVGTWINMGTLFVDGSRLELDGSFQIADIGTLTRNGGTIALTGILDNLGTTLPFDASTGSWSFDGGEVLGGTITTADGESLIPTGALHVLDAVTLAGDLTIPSGNRLRVRNGITLSSGSITLDGQSGSTILRLLGDQTIGGTGEIILAGTTGTNSVIGSGGTIYTIGSGITAHGRGTLGGGTTGFINQGTIRSDVSTLSLSGSSWSNEGSVEVISGASLSMTANGSNSGTISVDATSALSASSSYTQLAGTTTIDGTFTVSGLGTIDIQAGTLAGAGALTGDLTNAGTVAPGGILTLTGDFVQTSAGTLQIDIEGLTVGTQYDRFDVSGTATLAGTLELAPTAAYTPTVGDTLDVLLYASQTGSLALTGQDLGGGLVLDPTYGGTELTLTVATGP